MSITMTGMRWTYCNCCRRKLRIIDLRWTEQSYE